MMAERQGGENALGPSTAGDLAGTAADRRFRGTCLTGSRFMPAAAGHRADCAS